MKDKLIVTFGREITHTPQQVWQQQQDGFEAVVAYVKDPEFSKQLFQLVKSNPHLNSFTVKTPYFTISNMSRMGMNYLACNARGFNNIKTGEHQTAIEHLLSLQKMVLEEVYSDGTKVVSTGEVQL